MTDFNDPQRSVFASAFVFFCFAAVKAAFNIRQPVPLTDSRDPQAPGNVGILARFEPFELEHLSR